jgi:thiamine-phosphate pyrophosphorylase
MPTSELGAARRRLLADARLYLVCEAQPPGGDLLTLLPAAIAGGVRIVQLREKRMPAQQLVELARELQGVCRSHGALLIVNDDPEVALAAGADGVHLGQDDMPVERARELLGLEALIGLSTHTPAQIERACGPLGPGVDYIGVGPVHRTPTKPGRATVGLELVRYAARYAAVPFFAIGGIDAENLQGVVDAGASRVAVVRAIAHSPDPQAAAGALARGLKRTDAPDVPASEIEPRPPSSRDERLRAQLVALSPGERPLPLLIATAVCGLLAVGVIAGALTIHDLRARGGSIPGAIFLACVLGALTLGMYRVRYWAVLGFEALLAFQVLVTSLALVVASTIQAAVLCTVSVVLGGWLFWKLVRVMGRIQAGKHESGQSLR